jgi:hypothetical protein
MDSSGQMGAPFSEGKRGASRPEWRRLRPWRLRFPPPPLEVPGLGRHQATRGLLFHVRGTARQGARAWTWRPCRDFRSPAAGVPPSPAGPSASASAIPGAFHPTASVHPPRLVPGPRSSRTGPRAPALWPLPRSACGPARTPAARPYTLCSGSDDRPPPASPPPFREPRALAAAAVPRQARVSTPRPLRKPAGRTADMCAGGPRRWWAATHHSALSCGGTVEFSRMEPESAGPSLYKAWD